MTIILGLDDEEHKGDEAFAVQIRDAELVDTLLQYEPAVTDEPANV